MEHSESIKEIAAALSAFQTEVGNVKKDATNPFFKSKYATLENIIGTVKPVLAKHGLSYAQFPDGESGLTTIVMHTSGEYLMATASTHPKGQTPQDEGSAITYMRRYSLGGALGLATDDDDDGNAASQPAPKPAPKQAAKPKADPRKNTIVSLLKELGTKTGTREEIMESAYTLTGEELIEERYDVIIDKLYLLRDEIAENK